MLSHCSLALLPIVSPIFTNRAALSRLALAAWTRFKATSILNSERMPSSLEFMIAALAASSVVGASGNGVVERLGLRIKPLIGRGVEDPLGVSDRARCDGSSGLPFTSALAVAGLLDPNGE